MSTARKAALHLLSNEWSRGVWKQWLSNIFQPPVQPPMPTPAAAAEGSNDVNAPRSVSEPAVTQQFSRGKLEASCSSPNGDGADSVSARELRRREVRARFDALSDRLNAVEDGVETLLRRTSERDKAKRRADQQNVEAIDNVASAGERQATALEALLTTVSRLEHAVARLEVGLSRVERTLSERQRRDTHVPVAAAPPARSASQYPDSHLALRDRAPLSTRSSEVDDADPNEGAGINGYLSEMSLSTVMAMLEIERHTGRLKVATDDGMLASFELCEGNVISSRLSENDVDPLQTLRAALCWKQGRFWFRQQPAEPPSFPPRSIGSLLLEATRQNDESFAAVG